MCFLGNKVTNKYLIEAATQYPSITGTFVILTCCIKGALRSLRKLNDINKVLIKLENIIFVMSE